jgi:hypothetical protein
MNTYLMTWNPKHWDWKTLQRDALSTRAGRLVSEQWSCGNTRKITSGDRLFLLKQGGDLPKGIMASGYATSGVYEDKHFDPVLAEQGETKLFVDANWDAILDFMTEPLLQTSDVDGDGPPQVNWKTMSSGITVSAPAAQHIERLWSSHVAAVRGNNTIHKLAAIEADLVDGGYFDASHADERCRQLQEVVQRRGQPEFRTKLITAYQSRCAITGCDAVDALEAAHIMPYIGDKSNSTANGLLLRADIHSLFDLELLAIDPASNKVVLSNQLRRTTYAELEGRLLRIPDEQCNLPSPEALQQRWQRFKLQQALYGQ